MPSAARGPEESDKVQQTEVQVDDCPEEELREKHRRKWEMPRGCSEPLPQQASIRIADEVLRSWPRCSRMEKVDIAMETMGIAQKKRVSFCRTKQSQTSTTGPGASSAARCCCRDIENECALPRKSYNLEHTLHRRDGDKNQGGLDFAHDGAVFLQSKSERQVQVQTMVQGALFLTVMCFCGAKWNLHRRRTPSAGSVPEQLCEAPPGADEEKLGH